MTSPKVWPTKEELKGEAWLGEDPPPPVAHDNYPTAELFARKIEATFYEERALDMVDGPFTRSEAAERCRCKPEELCPGPLAGIDESDKIRTIYDGSKGGANAHIQAHTEEKTTAPMVGDCLHAIHWLRTAADHPHLLRAPLSGTEEKPCKVHQPGQGQLVFVDDYCWVLRCSRADWDATAILATLLALGVPLSWKKTALSPVNTWLGFVVDPITPCVLLAPVKHVIILATLKRLAQGDIFRRWSKP